MSVPLVALVVSIAGTIFSLGVYWGSLKGKLERTRAHLRDHGVRIRELEEQMRRMRIRARDVERAMGTVTKRPFTTRFPEDAGPLPGEAPHLSVIVEQEPKKE